MSEKLKRFVPEIIAMILWFAVTITIAVFHEPWFDEIQAWQIAAKATWHDLFFEVPHSECHPILWHLILRPFALAGLPFEPTIKAINILFTGLGCGLIMFKSKMPRTLRIVIPFSFMILYQTAIINRSYCILFTCFVILGLLRPERDEHPAAYCLTIAVMCVTHIMGIMMGGLLCLVWVFQIIGEYRKDKSKGNIFKDKRVLPLALLFVLAVFVMIMIFPSTENTNFDPNGFIESAGSLTYYLNLLVALPFEATFSPTQYKSGIVVCVLFFVLINAFMIYFCKKKKCMAEFLVPYIIFSLFYTFIWSWHHMMQVYFYFLVYIFTAFADEKQPVYREIVKKINKPALEKGVSVMTAALFLIMPLSAGASCYKDIKYTFFEARDIANFIKDNGLEDLRIFACWLFEPKEQEEENDSDYSINTDMSELKIDPYTDVSVRDNLYATTLAPYFGRMIIANHYDPGRDREYETYKKTTDQDRRDCYEKLSKEPYPDIIIGDMKVLDTIYGKDEVAKHHFKRVYRVYSYFTWKFDSIQYSYQTVWMREDLLEQYGVEEVPADFGTVE